LNNKVFDIIDARCNREVCIMYNLNELQGVDRVKSRRPYCAGMKH